MKTHEHASTSVECRTEPTTRSRKEGSKQRETRRTGIMKFLTTGKLGQALKTAGFLLAVEGQATHIINLSGEASANQDVTMAAPETAATHAIVHFVREDGQEEPVVDAAAVRAIASQIDQDRASGHEQRLTLPQIEPMQNQTGYHEETFGHMLRDAYPHFLVRAANVQRISFSDERSSMSRGYGTGGEEAAHATSAPGPEQAEIVMRTIMLNEAPTGDLSEARSMQLILTHELAHTADPTDNIDSTSQERLAFMNELADIVTHDELRVHFPYIESIENTNLTEERRIRLVEFFAEDIAYACEVHLAPNEDWQTGYENYLRRHFQATPVQAERAARLAINYIHRYSPDYDQHRGYNTRILYAQRLTAERQTWLVQHELQRTGEASKEGQDRLEHQYLHDLQSIDDPELRAEVMRIFADSQYWGHYGQPVTQPPRHASEGPSLRNQEAGRALAEWRTVVQSLLEYAHEIHTRSTDVARRTETMQRVTQSIHAFNDAYEQTPASYQGRLNQAALGYLNASVDTSISLQGLDE